MLEPVNDPIQGIITTSTPQLLLSLSVQCVRNVRAIRSNDSLQGILFTPFRKPSRETDREPAIQIAAAQLHAAIAASSFHHTPYLSPSAWYLRYRA